MKGVVVFCFMLCFGLNLADNGVVMCYWGSWANGRPGLARFGVDDLRTGLCTHIIYSFLGITADGSLTHPDQTVIQGKSNSVTEFVQLKESYPTLKLLTAIGGWVEGSDNFTIVVNNATLRAAFVSNVLAYLEQYNLDGVDLDWEYPAQRGGAESDKEAFIWLLEDLKVELQPRGLLLTSAVGVTQYIIDTSYYVANMSNILDYINLMTYDLNGWPYEVTGANAPLHPQLTDDPSSELNVAALINLWVANGADISKLVMGMANYGRSFTLANSTEPTTGVNATGPGAAGYFTAEDGFLAYYEICLSQQQNDWNITEVDSSYVYGNTGNFWIGYDNENTIKAKVEYAKSVGVGGIMFWAIDLDDFSGACNSSNRYPLIRAAVEAYRSDAKAVTAGFILTFVVSIFSLMRL